VTPNEWFDGIDRILFVHAHPDDETIATGGTLAALAEVGRDPAVLTLTRGEQGEVTEGPFKHLEGSSALAQHRQNELRTALTSLGVETHAWLGRDRVYEDSGMVWGADGFAVASPDSPETALTRAPAVDVVNDLLHAAVELGAGAIVSYDERGGYGHPDHVLAHRASRAVATALELPFWEIVETDVRRGDAPGAVVIHDVEPWMERKMMALRMYGTQLTVTGEREITHVGGQVQQFGSTEVFRRTKHPELPSQSRT